MIGLVGFDGDDTLWHSEGYYRAAQAEFETLVGAYVDRSGTGTVLECGGIGNAECATCLAALTHQTSNELCTDDGPPSSKDISDAFHACTCDDGPDFCASACGDSACSNQAPSDDCRACIDTKCEKEKVACFGGGGA